MRHRAVFSIGHPVFRRDSKMKTSRNILIALISMFMLASVAYTQDTSSVIDFFMHDRLHDTFLRDHYRFEEPRPLRIEYWYTNWRDTDEDTGEYRDYLHIEGLVPIYDAKNLKVDIPFQYSRVPVWAESEENVFGRNISVARPHLIARWVISDRLRSIFGLEYGLKGDSKNIGRPVGKRISLLAGIFSYEVNTQLNLAAGMRFDRYYYDTDEVSDVFELTDRLYYEPAIMLNWHPSDAFTVLLGIPAVGVNLSPVNTVRAEARANINGEAEIALRVKPVERVNATLRFTNIPYEEIPIKPRSLYENEISAEKLCFTNRSVLFEIGRELNPAALASVGVRYSPGRDVELEDRSGKKVAELDGKPYFSIGATFIMDLEALIQKR